MDRGSDWWLLFPERVRRFPADLAVTVGLTCLTVIVVLAPIIRETPLRVVFGLPFVLFLPGYAFIAALFPEDGDSPSGDGLFGDSDDAASASKGTGETHSDDADPDDKQSDESGRLTAAVSPATDRGIDGIERVALSFGLSIAIVPLIGLGLNFTPWGITLIPILLSVSGFTVGCAVVAAFRRWDLPEDERFRVPYREWIEAARAEVFEPDDRVDAALNVLLAASILLAVGSVGYAIAVPPQGEQFTEFYLLTEDEDGDRVAADYPEELVVGEPEELIVGVGNNEHESVDYTVVVQLQEVELIENQSLEQELDEQAQQPDAELNETQVNVLDRTELDRFELRLGHNETWQEPRDVTATQSGENLRLQYLLFRGEPPEAPTQETAYRDLHLWVDVEP